MHDMITITINSSAKIVKFMVQGSGVQSLRVKSIWPCRENALNLRENLHLYVHSSER